MARSRRSRIWRQADRSPPCLRSAPFPTAQASFGPIVAAGSCAESSSLAESAAWAMKQKRRRVGADDRNRSKREARSRSHQTPASPGSVAQMLRAPPRRDRWSRRLAAVQRQTAAECCDSSSLAERRRRSRPLFRSPVARSGYVASAADGVKTSSCRVRGRSAPGP
jgi:hypothetical protein